MAKTKTFEEKWDAKFIHIQTPSIRKTSGVCDLTDRNFIIVTPEELGAILLKTDDRIKEYNKTKPGEYEEYEK